MASQFSPSEKSGTEASFCKATDTLTYVLEGLAARGVVQSKKERLSKLEGRKCERQTHSMLENPVSPFSAQSVVLHQVNVAKSKRGRSITEYWKRKPKQKSLEICVVQRPSNPPSKISAHTDCKPAVEADQRSFPQRRPSGRLFF